MEEYNVWFDEQSEYSPGDAAVAVGEEVPDWKLTEIEGNPVTLGDFREIKHLVLVFGSMT